jgi:DNA-binding NtrC family response regulator
MDGEAEMIEWSALAQRLGYASDEAMWADLYDVKHLSVAALATRLGISRNAIRSTLKKRGAGMRKRGGANNRREDLSDEIIDEVRKDGVMAVAKRMKVKYTTLYKRLRRMGMTVAELQKEVERGDKDVSV